MRRDKPITPVEAEAYRRVSDNLIQATNLLLKERLRPEGAVFSQAELFDLVEKLNQHVELPAPVAEMLQHTQALRHFGMIFTEAGWDIFVTNGPYLTYRFKPFSQRINHDP